jgi:cytochrome c biogenesis protein ResB
MFKFNINDVFIVSLRDCLYGSEPARVPELARIPEMNLTTRLHETYMKAGSSCSNFFWRKQLHTVYGSWFLIWELFVHSELF